MAAPRASVWPRLAGSLLKSLLQSALLIGATLLLSRLNPKLGLSFGVLSSAFFVLRSFHREWRLTWLTCLLPALCSVGCLLFQWAMLRPGGSQQLLAVAPLPAIFVGWLCGRGHRIFERQGQVWARKTSIHLLVWVASVVFTQVVALFDLRAMVAPGLVGSGFSMVMVVTMSIVLLGRYRRLRRALVPPRLPHGAAAVLLLAVLLAGAASVRAEIKPGIYQGGLDQQKLAAVYEAMRLDNARMGFGSTVNISATDARVQINPDGSALLLNEVEFRWVETYRGTGVAHYIFSPLPQSGRCRRTLVVDAPDNWMSEPMEEGAVRVEAAADGAGLLWLDNRGGPNAYGRIPWLLHYQGSLTGGTAFLHLLREWLSRAGPIDFTDPKAASAAAVIVLFLLAAAGMNLASSGASALALAGQAPAGAAPPVLPPPPLIDPDTGAPLNVRDGKYFFGGAWMSREQASRLLAEREAQRQADAQEAADREQRNRDFEAFADENERRRQEKLTRDGQSYNRDADAWVPAGHIYDGELNLVYPPPPAGDPEQLKWVGKEPRPLADIYGLQDYIDDNLDKLPAAMQGHVRGQLAQINLSDPYNVSPQDYERLLRTARAVESTRIGQDEGAAAAADHRAIDREETNAFIKNFGYGTARFAISRLDPTQGVLTGAAFSYFTAPEGKGISHAIIGGAAGYLGAVTGAMNPGAISWHMTTGAAIGAGEQALYGGSWEDIGRGALLGGAMDGLSALGQKPSVRSWLDGTEPRVSAATNRGAGLADTPAAPAVAAGLLEESGGGARPTAGGRVPPPAGATEPGAARAALPERPPPAPASDVTLLGETAVSPPSRIPSGPPPPAPAPTPQGDTSISLPARTPPPPEAPASSSFGETAASPPARTPPPAETPPAGVALGETQVHAPQRPAGAAGAPAASGPEATPASPGAGAGHAVAGEPAGAADRFREATGVRVLSPPGAQRPRFDENDLVDYAMNKYRGMDPHDAIDRAKQDLGEQYAYHEQEAELRANPQGYQPTARFTVNHGLKNAVRDEYAGWVMQRGAIEKLPVGGDAGFQGYPPEDFLNPRSAAQLRADLDAEQGGGFSRTFPDRTLDWESTGPHARSSADWIEWDKAHPGRPRGDSPESMDRRLKDVQRILDEHRGDTPDLTEFDRKIREANAAAGQMGVDDAGRSRWTRFQDELASRIDLSTAKNKELMARWTYYVLERGKGTPPWFRTDLGS